MANHPELEAEQDYIDHAYESLERSRAVVASMREGVVDGRGGTFQNRFERDVVWDSVAARLEQLEIGDRSLVFGRIDTDPDAPDATNPDAPGHSASPHSATPDGASSHRAGEGSETYYIGRIAVADDHSNPVVVDWRAPVAESFYRATGVDPMKLRRRRHFASRGSKLLGIDDELFGSAAQALDSGEVQGQGALIAALEESRSGRLSDIVATIQAEQDVIIRSELPGVLVVQGGPGTGKTVVALHRAAYLLYSQRFPLEGQGVLVIGPNRLFLSYIEQVLPSLGEAGVHMKVLADLVPHIRATGNDAPDVAHLKGDLRMVRVIRRAVRDRQQPLREPLRVPYGVQWLRLSVQRSEEIIRAVRRRSRTHNSGRKLLEELVFAALAESGRDEQTAEVVRERTRRHPVVVEALERMWPVLTPAQLVNDLLGSPALLRSASRSLETGEWKLLRRERLPDGNDAVFTHDDVPLLDEALELLGPRQRYKDADSIRTYGHIVVDEAQDLTPMQLRVLDRRSLNGSMTIVGDIAQATGPWPHANWQSVLEHLPERRAPRHADLSVGYRVPGPIMDLASRVLPLAAPGLEPPRSIRTEGEPPALFEVGPADFGVELAAVVRRELDSVGAGNIAVVVPDALAERVSEHLSAAGVEHGTASRQGLDRQVTIVPVSVAKGLELDSVVVVEPARILRDSPRGSQLLYVALTRSTRRLTLIATEPLPAVLG